jgi:hypothetical protein
VEKGKRYLSQTCRSYLLWQRVFAEERAREVDQELRVVDNGYGEDR